RRTPRRDGEKCGRAAGEGVAASARGGGRRDGATGQEARCPRGPLPRAGSPSAVPTGVGRTASTRAGGCRGAARGGLARRPPTKGGERRWRWPQVHLVTADSARSEAPLEQAFGHHRTGVRTVKRPEYA